MEQPKTLIAQIARMFEKIAARTITREEGTLFLNDLVRRSKDKDAVVWAIMELCKMPPRGVYEKTIFHTVALSRNEAFEPILRIGLGHKNEEISLVSAEGLSKLETDRAKQILVEHLSNDSYHVRKASATALIRGFGREGLQLVRTHGLSHPETYYRLTSAYALANAGKMGIAILLEVLGLSDINALGTVAEALADVAGKLDKKDMPVLAHALETAVNSKHPQAVLAILSVLKLFTAVSEKAEGFEEHIAVLLRHGYEPVRNAAREALGRIGSEKARKFIEQTPWRPTSSP